MGHAISDWLLVNFFTAHDFLCTNVKSGMGDVNISEGEFHIDLGISLWSGDCHKKGVSGGIKGRFHSGMTFLCFKMNL